MRIKKNKGKKNKLKIYENANFKDKGITLVALVVTIIVLLILAGVALGAIFNKNGIIVIAEDARKQAEIAQLKEAMEITLQTTLIDGTGKIDRVKFFEELESQKIINDKTKDIVSNDDRIYEVTTKSGYVFEIELLNNKENPSGAKIEYIGEKGNLPPRVKSITTTNKTLVSIEIEAEITRLEDGKLSYYYKETNEPETAYKVVKENVNDLKVTAEGLTIGKIYDIKVVVKNKKGQHELVVKGAIQQLVTSLILDKETANIKPQGTLQLIPTILPDNAENKTIKWTSGDENIATVDDNGLVTTRMIGDTVITAKTTDGSEIEASCNLSVKIPVEEIQLNETEKNININETKTYTLLATIQPEDATNQKVKWSSSEPSIAEVDQNGVVTARKIGTTVITATSEDDKTKSCSCTVTIREESDWELINKIAKEIANSSYTKTSESATVTVEGKSYTINVGQIFTVKYNEEVRRVRVLGFNHDKLINTNEYDGNNTTAGISFEFYDFMLGEETVGIHASLGSGWKNIKLRTDLNGTADEIGGYGGNLSNKKYIKKVEKLYLNPNSTTLLTCSDWLWCLSCAEIWNVGAEQGVVGFAKAREGEQYCFYKKNVGDSISSGYLIKKTSETGSQKNWALRSHIFTGRDWTYVKDSGGIGTTYGHGVPGIPCGVAPGFAI